MTCYVLLQALESLRRQVALEQRLMPLIRELLEMQTCRRRSKRGQLLMETDQQTRQMRHDLRHHLTADPGHGRRREPQAGRLSSLN